MRAAASTESGGGQRGSERDQEEQRKGDPLTIQLPSHIFFIYALFTTSRALLLSRAAPFATPVELSERCGAQYYGLEKGGSKAHVTRLLHRKDCFYVVDASYRGLKFQETSKHKQTLSSGYFPTFLRLSRVTSYSLARKTFMF